MLKKNLTPDPTRPKKQLQFNTHLFQMSDTSLNYGLITLPEAKTPFPRYECGVDSNILRGKLMDAISQSTDRRIYSTESLDIQMHVLETLQPQSHRKMLFLEKRRKLQTAEFLVTKQCPTNKIIHDPGESIPIDGIVDELPKNIDCKVHVKTIH